MGRYWWAGLDLGHTSAAANGRNVIFHFAEHSPAAVHAASLGGISPVFRLGPGHIGVLTRRINEEIPDYECMFVAGRIYVANAAGGHRRAHSDFVFAGRPHPEADQTIAGREFVGR